MHAVLGTLYPVNSHKSNNVIYLTIIVDVRMFVKKNKKKNKPLSLQVSTVANCIEYTYVYVLTSVNFLQLSDAFPL